MLQVRFSLRRRSDQQQHRPRKLAADSLIQIRRLDVTQPLRLTRAYEYQICRNKIITLDTNDVADLDVFRFLLLEYRIASENLGSARDALNPRNSAPFQV